MSRKIDTFREKLGTPLTASNFEIEIPALPGNYGDNAVFTVQSSTFPSDKLRVIAMKYWGETINYPTLPENSHRWKVTFPENTNGQAFKSMMRARNLWYEQYSGLMLVPTSLMQFCKIKMIDNEGGEIFSAKMWNAFVIGPDDFAVASSEATTNVNLSVEFVYDWIQYNT